MKELSLNDFSVIVGIDWADQKHDICEFHANDQSYSASIISSKPESVHEWAINLQQRFPEQKIAVACELKKGPLVYALMKHAHIVILPIHPATVAKYRKAFKPSGAKSDVLDAKVQVELVQTHFDKLTALKPDTVEVRALAQLVEYRRKLVQDRVDLTNSITWHLKNYFPQVLDWFTEKDSHLFADFVLRWPTLESLKGARRTTLVNFMHQHNVRKKQLIDQRIDTIKGAVALTDDDGVILPNRLMVESIAQQIKSLLGSIETMDKEIRRLYKSMDDRAIFDSLPGAGPQMAPRLLVAFGSNRDRYSDASEVQRYGGIAPVIESSGNKSWTHWRYSCPKFLRQTFVE